MVRCGIIRVEVESPLEFLLGDVALELRRHTAAAASLPVFLPVNIAFVIGTPASASRVIAVVPQCDGIPQLGKRSRLLGGTFDSG
jgi:hypothetical protein